MSHPSPKNTNKSRLSKELMASIYESVILQWELGLKDHKNFSIRAKEFQTFRRSFELVLEPMKSAVEFETRSQSPWPAKRNWIVFSDGEGSQARSVLKHLRNAAAHGHIEKGGTTLQFNSYNTKGKQVMQGQLESKIFIDFIKALLKTAVIKTPKGVGP